MKKRRLHYCHGAALHRVFFKHNPFEYLLQLINPWNTYNATNGILLILTEKLFASFWEQRFCGQLGVPPDAAKLFRKVHVLSVKDYQRTKNEIASYWTLNRLQVTLGWRNTGKFSIVRQFSTESQHISFMCSLQIMHLRVIEIKGHSSIWLTLELYKCCPFRTL